MSVKESRLLEIADLSRHPGQSEVFLNQKRFRVISAGRRWGKTTLAVNELLQNAYLKRDSMNWYVAPTYRQAKMIAWKMLEDLIPSELVFKKSEHELKFILLNGSEICLKGAENEDSLRGVGVSFCVLDEYAYMKANVWEEIIRPMLTDTGGRALFISTPRGKNHFWEIWLRGQKRDKEWKSWKFKTGDSPFISEEEIENARRFLSPRYFRQEFEAEFEDYVGLIWPEFNVDKDVIAPFPIPQEWYRTGAIDPALSGTTGVLVGAIDLEGRLYIYWEFYRDMQRVEDIAREISRHGDIEWVIDPASKGQQVWREGRLSSLYDEFIRHGLDVVVGENDVYAGINRVGELFRAGKIKIFATCKNLIWELERYHWSERRETLSGIIEPKPYKADDHLCDCLRYMVMRGNAGRRGLGGISGQEKEGRLPRYCLERLEQMLEGKGKSWKENFV